MNSAVHFDRAIVLAGYGKFHYQLVAVCALCFLAVGFQNGMSAYVLPAAQCDLGLTSAEMGFLNVSFLLAGLAGRYGWSLTSVTTMLIGGLAACVMFWLNTGHQYLIASSVFQAAMSTGNMTKKRRRRLYLSSWCPVPCLSVRQPYPGHLGAAAISPFELLLLDQSCEDPIFVADVNSFLGGIASALLWGLMADILGRKRVLVTTIFVDWVITFTSSISSSYEALAAFRFLDGFFIGAPGTIIFLYLAEFHAEHKKSRSVCYVGLFFTLSWVLLPAFAWLIIPLKFEVVVMGVNLKTWRWFIMVLSLNLLIGGSFLMLFPESPKFLLARGEKKMALQVLKGMYAKNYGKLPEEYPVKTLLDDQKIKDDPKDPSGPVGQGRIVRLVKDMTDQIKSLFQRPLICLTVLSSLLLFTNMYGFYGLGLWIPEIFSRFEEFSLIFPEKRLTFCQIQDQFFGNLSHPKIQDHHGQSAPNCNNELDTTVFINTIVMGLCCCAGNIVSAGLAGRYDRRLIPVTTMLIGGLAACVMFWLDTGNQHLIASSVFQAAMSTGNMAMNGVVVDIFPADVSAMAVCTATLAGRLGAVVSNLSFGLLLDQSCEVPIFVVGAILAIGGVLGLFLPAGKTKKIDMLEGEKVPEKMEKIPEISIVSVD